MSAKLSPEARRQRELDDWRELLSLPAGQRVLSRLALTTGVLGGSYSPGDSLATAYNEGLRRLGLFILAEIRAASGDPAALGRHLATILTTEEDSHERRHIDHDQY